MTDAKKRADKIKAARDREESAKKTVEARKEEESWAVGSKKSGKIEAQAEKASLAAEKKRERKLLEKQENDAIWTKSRVKAAKPHRNVDNLDLLQENPALNASNIDDALDLLNLGKTDEISVEKHPERRYKAALNKYKANRLDKLKLEHPGLRTNQYDEIISKEFKKHPNNPFNAIVVSHNTSKEDILQAKNQHARAIQNRLESS